MENCNNCEYNNKVICTQCSQNYIIKDEETDKCYLYEEYSNNEYYKLDEFNIKSCNKAKDNCKECEKKSDNKINCTKCEDMFRLLSNNTCIPIIENCEIYSEENVEECRKCMSGFAFEEDNRDICKNILNDLYEYFSKDGKISYLKCDDIDKGGLENCKTCEYDNENNKVICTQCKSGFILIDSDTDTCYPDSNYINNKEYYYEDEYHIKKCSFNLNNCLECEKLDNKLKCIKCKSDYVVINDEKNHCEKLENINTDKYYIEQEQFYSCLFYNQIGNCQKCEQKESCLLCKDGFTFINDDKSTCENLEELGKHYFIDENDRTIYRKCSDFMDNCDTCSKVDECLTCEENYGLYNDRKSCINLEEQLHYEIEGLYYLCNTGIANCIKCSAYNQCIQCDEDYIKINNDKSICHPINNINIEEYFIDPKDNSNYIQCSKYINNCLLCEYQNGCITCKDGFIMLNENKNVCHEKIKTDLNGYFSDDNMNYFSCKETKYKNDIRCFELIPEQNIILELIQVQIVNKKLVCYMITHSPLPSNFSLKIKINIYQSTFRNLDSSIEREIILNTADDSNGSENKILSFTSNEEFTNEEIQVKEISFNNDNPVTKTVTDNNKCSIKYDSNSELLDTGKVKSKIRDRKIPDCSTIQSRNIINLSMDKVINCEFNLNSNNKVSFSTDKLNLELIESENNENKITAECDTTKNNVKSIKCNINKDGKEEINNDYSFKDKFLFESNNFIIISSEQDKFKIFCENKKTKKTLIIIIVVACAVVILIVVLITTIIICKKDKKKKEENNGDSVDSEEISNKNLNNKKKIRNAKSKIKIIDSEQKETDILSINNKRKNQRSKTRKST